MAKRNNFKFEDAIDAIEEYIDTNDLKENDGLPAERKLAEELRLSRGTVREALATLEREGRIYKIHGKGNFVAAEKYSVNIVDMQFRSVIKRGNRNILERKVVHFKKMLAGSVVAEKLGIQSEDEIYMLSRVRKIGGRAILLENAYLPAAYIPGFEKYDFEKESVYSTLKRDYGIEVIEQSLNLQLSRASEIEAQYLGIDAGDIVFVEKDIARDANNRRIEYSKSILVSKYVKYQIDFDRSRNVLVLNELKLKMLCEKKTDSDRRSYAESTFSNMYWNRAADVLSISKSRGEHISFCYNLPGEEDMFEHTALFADYIFVRTEFSDGVEKILEREDIKESSLIVIFYKDTIVIRDAEGTDHYGADTAEIELDNFCQRYLFGFVRNHDRDSCMKYAINQFIGEGKLR